MRTRRIELDGAAGHVAIEREPGSTTIRIDVIIRDPKREPQTWKTWHLPGSISDEYLFHIATEVQLRCDGHAGTNSDIHDYFHEIQRFQD